MTSMPWTAFGGAPSPPAIARVADPVGDPVADPVGVQLIDHDPISRHVIERYLRSSPGIRLVASSAEHTDPRIRHHLGATDVAVLACGPDRCCTDPRRLTANTQALASRGARVLLLGSHWSRHLLQSAISAGVQGCLVKTPALDGLAAGIRAVFEKQCVLSPELLGWSVGLLVPGRSARTAGGGAAGTGPHQLTGREREVLDLLARGISTQEAAATLRISPATVKSHVSHALTKLGVRNRLEAVLSLREAVHGDGRE